MWGVKIIFWITFQTVLNKTALLNLTNLFISVINLNVNSMYKHVILREFYA